MMPDASLTLRRTIPAPPLEVYRAWTEPAVLMQWFGPPGHGLASAEMDLRVGGGYRFGMRELPDGEVAYVRGEYRELTPPSRLVFTWSWESSAKSAARDTVVKILLTAVAAGTEIVLTHELLPNQKEYESHELGWRAVLLELEEHFKSTEGEESV